MGEIETGVNGPEAPAGDVNTNPEPKQDASESGGGTGEGENRIPISRAEEMWQRREAKLRKEWEEKELSPIRQRYESDQRRLADAEIARLKAMGWLTEEQPKPVTQAELEKILNERFTKASEAERTERLQLYYAQRIDDGWREANRKYPKLVARPGFQNAVLAIYAENPQTDFMSICDEVAKGYDAYFAERDADAQKERETRRSPDRRVVPGGRGAAGGGSGGRGEKRKTVGEKIADRIRAMKESE